MRRLTSLVLSTAVTAATLAALPAPAQAQAPAFDVYALKSPGLHVRTGSCRSVRVTARTTAPRWMRSVDATVDLWRGAKSVGDVWLRPVNDNPRRLAGTFYYCPNIDPLGRYRLGPSEVSYYDDNYNDGTFIDTSRGTMVIKQATRARSFTATRAGARRTFRAHLQYFGLSNWGDHSWANDPRGTRVRLQRRAASGRGTWKRVATSRVGDRGRVTLTVRAGKRFQYRVAVAGTRRSWALTSRPLTK